MGAERVVDGVLTFLGGIAAGWMLRAVSGGERGGGGVSGAAAREGPKKRAAAKKKATSSSGSGTKAAGSGSKAAAGGAAAAAKPRLLQLPRGEMKMVLCVNTGLGMGKGKIGEYGLQRQALGVDLKWENWWPRAAA